MNALKYALLIAVVLAGCSGNDKDLSEIRQQLRTCQAEVTKLKGQVNLLSTKLDLQGMRLDVLSESRDRAEFDPSSAGYSPVETSSGRFMVSLDKLVPYANGYRATFRVGNPNFATYTSPRIKVEWGRAIDWKNESYADWETSLRSTEITHFAGLQPGSWNVVKVTLAPATPEEIAAIRFTLTTDSVSLRSR